LLGDEGAALVLRLVVALDDFDLQLGVAGLDTALGIDLGDGKLRAVAHRHAHRRGAGAERAGDGELEGIRGERGDGQDGRQNGGEKSLHESWTSPEEGGAESGRAADGTTGWGGGGRRQSRSKVEKLPFSSRTVPQTLWEAWCSLMPKDTGAPVPRSRPRICSSESMIFSVSALGPALFRPSMRSFATRYPSSE